MKVIIFCLVSIFYAGIPSYVTAQSRFGFRFGAGNYDVLRDTLRLPLVPNPSADSIFPEEISLGFFVGLVSQINMGGFIIQPEILLHQAQIDYKVFKPTGNSSVYKEKTRSLHIPLMIGTKAGPLRLNAGPVAHWIFQSESNLWNVDGFKPNMHRYNWGFQAGMGIDFWKILIDLRYEGSFHKFGNHLIYHDQKISFQDQPKRLIASVAFVF